MDQTTSVRRCVLRGVAALVLLLAMPQSEAGEPAHGRGRLFRFEFDNDTFIGSDDAFTAGWSLQFHGEAQDTWSGPIGRTVARLPGLGDDGSGGRLVRHGYGIGQQMFTPQDIEIAEPQPKDAPWAGILALFASWEALDNDRFGAFQVTAGCIGPCSQAEDAQKFVHEDLHRGPSPRGWHNQLKQRLLVNLNYDLRWKLVTAREDRYSPGRWAQDLTVGSQFGLGNLATFADAILEWRVGRNLPRGFTSIPDPAGMGVASDPVLPQSAGGRGAWRFYATVIVRGTYMVRHVVAEGGATVDGPPHPGLDLARPSCEAIGALHFGTERISLNVSRYQYFGERVRISHGTSPDWIALALDVRY